ncbi:amidohydrolase family protein [Leeuwenhoekiella palythoae]|uniref:Imidazolonepropionase n=1 Tax=Leeuwenhoekiella palythoae TaxID=573501 RepID=A0A1M5T231_9FLAO|nr:amidohydrolase family protein [Leeuwenhoekiella palythoae]RXG28787.1 imidazolonepropionase-like amidohydrolase [Leeuwenhoekiella palythoae]SHH44839.1 Imidazolonepropionase [Leeuwenhoekiella palythoae]
MNKKLFFTGWLLFVFCMVSGQEYFPVNDGVKSINTNYTLFKNATLHPSPGKTISSGSLLIKDGKIVSAGKSVNAPKNAVVIDLEGKHIYPSFVETYSSFGVKIPERSFGGRSPQYEATRAGYYWNDHVRAETNALNEFEYDNKAAKALVEAGFGTVSTHMADGLARGNGILVALNSDGNTAERLLDTRSAQFFSFEKSNLSQQSYPSSIMGSTALIRQMFEDADWYEAGNIDTRDLSLEALNANMDLPQIFYGDGLYDDLRIASLSQETGVPFIIVGGGDEYKRIDEIKATGAQYIIPVNFQDAYDVEDPYQASFVSLSQMLEWNQEPTNPAKLQEAGLTFAITTNDLKSPDMLFPMLRKAFKYGLEEETALAALTTIPAQLLGKSEELGTLNQNAWANFLITSGPIFDKETILYENWVQGAQNIIKDASVIDIDGSYTLTTGGKSYDLTISKSTEKPSVTAKDGETKLGSKIAYTDGWLNITFTGDADKKEYTRIIAQASNTTPWNGKAILPDGSESTFSISKKASTEEEEEKEEDKEEITPEVMPLTYPNVAYGYDEQPQAETILFKNATVWTNEEDGILEETDVLVKNGKIDKIGKDLSAGGAKVIDATGKHLTSGIVDEHSHIAAFSINESGQNSSAEVRMRDAVNPDDLDIYRDLAGGVTTIQLLHGSANPIGGQSAVMKLKWGSSIDEMVLENTKFIKFALGENVKQSNWGSYSRFPQTRMGVQQMFTDYFQRAKEYEAKKNSGEPYRTDYEMETLMDVLNEERHITSHSYVQSEINMLMKVADSFDFNVNTFTHILEGYKVADKMAEHGVAGSTFSDWWAYKYEVNDAIPYNAAIMWSQGVLTGINSDDAEMSRRLNQEAAKTMKYGGVPEEEAWKFVTLNPAKMLHIDDRTGSIKVGKDADLVLWSTYPMSVSAVAEKTLVEGAVYFDIEKDKELKEKVEAKKNKLTTMMLSAKNKGLKTQPAKKEEKQRLDCDTLETLY